MTDVRTQHINGPMAWTADSAPADDGIVRLSAICLSEVSSVAAALATDARPIEALAPDEFPMTACRALMTSVRRELSEGVGVVVIDRLPVDELGPSVAAKIYWLLLSMAGRPVAQKWNGQVIYDVTDTGLTEEAGNGVRSSKTNQGQYYHTDNSFNLPPEFVSLCCLKTAKAGGVSGLVSFQAAYNCLLEDAPELIGRFYRPFYFDRQMEHAPDDERLSFKPVMVAGAGGVDVNFSRRLIEYGYKLAGEPMDNEARAALEALTSIIERPELNREFAFQPGQIQILNNRRIGHRRTAFEDWPEPERKRHLVRLWLRDSGGPGYVG